MPELAFDPSLRAREGAREFGNQLFGGVALIAEAAGEVAVKAGLCAGPVTKLVERGRIAQNPVFMGGHQLVDSASFETPSVSSVRATRKARIGRAMLRSRLTPSGSRHSAKRSPR
jgi:hypothetical protein